MVSNPYDSGDYDTDDRIKCRSCGEWTWPDAPDEPKVCEQCEERFCKECMSTHKCWTEGPS